MDSSIQKDIRDLKKGQDTIMEILDGMAAKQDQVDTRLGQFDARLDRLEGRQDGFEEKVDRRFNQLEQRFDRVMTALDGIAGKLNDRRTEEAATTILLGAHAKQLVDYDKRITKLEKAVA